MNEQSHIRPTAEAKGYLDALKQNRVFSRAVDAYAFASAFAMKLDLDPDSAPMKGRTDLVDVQAIDKDTRLALECGIVALRRRKTLEPLTDASSILEYVTRYAEVGIRALRERWEGKGSIQILDDIKKIMAEK